MTTRVITIPAVNKQIPLDVYVRGVRNAIANPDKEYNHGLTTWTACNGSEIRKQFLESVHDRINKKAGLTIPDTDISAFLMRHRDRLNRTCSWCGTPLKPEQINIGMKHSFCSTECVSAYYGR